MGTDHAQRPLRAAPSLNRSAFAATWHCLTGCAIGEVLGLVIATALGWGNAASIAIAVVLAFFFGYALTLRPLVTGGVPLSSGAADRRLRADTVSITVMEIVDNARLACTGGDGGRPRRLAFWGVSPSACSSRSGPRSP
jgi:hypothetical protein